MADAPAVTAPTNQEEENWRGWSSVRHFAEWMENRENREWMRSVLDVFDRSEEQLARIDQLLARRNGSRQEPVLVGYEMPPTNLPQASAPDSPDGSASAPPTAPPHPEEDQLMAQERTIDQAQHRLEEIEAREKVLEAELQALKKEWREVEDWLWDQWYPETPPEARRALSLPTVRRYIQREAAQQVLSAASAPFPIQEQEQTFEVLTHSMGWLDPETGQMCQVSILPPWEIETLWSPQTREWAGSLWGSAPDSSASDGPTGPRHPPAPHPRPGKPRTAEPSA